MFLNGIFSFSSPAFDLLLTPYGQFSQKLCIVVSIYRKTIYSPRSVRVFTGSERLAIPVFVCLIITQIHWITWHASTSLKYTDVLRQTDY